MEDEYASFVTACPSCGKDDLYVIRGTFYAEGVRLYPDGFSLCDAKLVDTEDEVVRCGICGWEGSLEVLSP